MTTPGTTGLVNALCAVQLNLVGCGFFPNEDDDDMSGLPRGDGHTDPEARQDRDDGSDVVVRHERRRNSGDDGGVGERDTSKL